MPATPACIAYNALDGIENYAHPGALAIVENSIIDDQRVKAVASAGASVAIYLNFMEAPDTYGSLDRDLLYGGHPIREEWRWSPRRYNWPGSTMTDVRRGSAWWAQVFATLGPVLERHPHVTHVMADVQGERLWSAVWTAGAANGGMTDAEKSAWTDGMNWAAPRLHEIAAAHGVRIIVNGSWANGNVNFEGAAIENHPIAENANGTWTEYLAKPWGGTDHVAYCRTLAEALAWSKVPGIRWVALQPNGYAKPGPVWGAFPTPDPDPDPAPPPTVPLARPSAPAPPTVDNPAAGRIDVNGGAPIPAELVDSFRVYINDVDPGRDNPIGETATIINLNPTAPATVRVSYHNASTDNAGHGPWSDVVTLTPSGPPPPPPDLDPCRDLRATLAQTISEMTAEREKSGELSTQLDASIAQVLGLVARAEAAEAAARTATAERDEARAALAEATADIEAIEGDLRKIRGSAGSSAGKAADRLRAVKGRAAIALARREG